MHSIRGSRALRPWVRGAVLALALLSIIGLLHTQWEAIQRQPWQLRGERLALAAGLLSLAWLVEVLLWRRSLHLWGGRLGWGQALYVWFASILVRYIPGNLWQPLGMTLLAQERGVRPVATMASIALYQAINLLSALPFAGAYLQWVDRGWVDGELRLGAGGDMGWLLLAGLPFLVLLLRPGWLQAGLDGLLRALGREPLDASLRARDLAILWLGGLVDWILWSGAFALLAGAVLELPGRAEVWAGLLTAYPVAYAVGYLSFVAPGGLAIREGALALLLAPVLGPGPGILLALAMRTLQVVLEVLWAGCVLLFGTDGRIWRP